MGNGEMMAAGLMEGKRGLVMGVANQSSIAWAAAQALHAHGAEMAFTYQSNVFQSRVAPLAERVAAPLVLPANVQDASSLDALFEAIEMKWGHLDFLLHAIAHSDRTELQGRYLNTSRNNFLNTMEISCFSFTDLAKRARPLMRPGASLLTLTYLGSERVIPNYNVMGVAKAALEASMRYLAFDLGSEGIRVNALSPGPMRTLAASGIRNVRKVHMEAASNAPLRRNATLDEVGSAALFMLSDLSAGITGEVIYVDGGYNIMGMAAEENL